MPEHSPAGQPPRRSALDRFLSGLAESVFMGKLGVADIQLVDYLSDLMLRFVRFDGMHRIRRGTGEPAVEVYQMVVEGEKRIGLARRDAHRHIGDVTLFWSGVYPESLRRQRRAGSVDGFLDYCREGKRAYRIAAEIEADPERPPSHLLQRLSEQYDLCAYGLREMRRAWEDSDEQGPGGLLLS